MDISEGKGSKEERQRRVFFWFVCSALGGVCAREIFKNTPEQITEETFKIAEAMTKHWMDNYGTLSE